VSAAPLIPLRDLVLAVATWNPQKPGTADETFNYIDLSAVDQDLKTITGARTVPCAEAPSRARQIVRIGDVLVSTVRPNLNGVALVPAELDGATASTGFCVIRPNPKLLNSSFVFHWVKSPSFVSSMVNQATGASYPAVSDRIVLDSRISLPPLLEQRRIAAILEKADALRTKRREALAQLDRLAQSIFIEMFGDPMSPTARWQPVPVSGFVAGFESGKSVAAEDEEDSSSQYRVLKVSAVTSLEFKPSESKAAPPDHTPQDSHFVRPGDLLFSRANTTELIGATAYVVDTPDNLLLPDKLWRFVWHDAPRATPHFVNFLFRQPKFRAEIGRRASGSSGSMKNISQEKVLSIEAALPPVTLQQEFSDRIEKVMRMKAAQLPAVGAVDALFASLQHRAFQGEL